MGIFAGWREIADNVTVQARVVDHEYNGGLFGDGDWILKVDTGVSLFLLLSRLGSAGLIATNPDGIVECEVEPNDSIGDGSREARLFGPLQGKDVTLTGTLVQDLAHDDKLEIHPVTSIFFDRGPVDGMKAVEFFVFSDDSSNFPTAVPHSGEDRRGLFNVPYDSAPAAPVVVPRFAETELTDMSGSKQIRAFSQGNRFFLEADIRSGVAPNAGFYHAVILMWFDSAGIDLTGFQASPPKQFVMANGVWSIRYDVHAELVLVGQSPGIAFQRVDWKLQRRDQQDLVSGGNAVVDFRAVELSRGRDGQLDYHPQLLAEAIVPGAAPVSIRRVLDLQQPQVRLERISPQGFPEGGFPGRLLPHQGLLKKVVWTVRCRVTVDGFLTPPDLQYSWTLIPGGPNQQNRVESSGAGTMIGAQQDLSFELEYALPEKDTYSYWLSVVVTDGHQIGRAVATREIRLLGPSARIVGHVDVLRPPDAGGTGLYRFTGDAATARLYDPLSYQWSVDNQARGAISNQSQDDLHGYGFDFEYNMLDLDGLPPPGPQVTLVVRDVAGQIARGTVDVSDLVPEVSRARSRAFAQLTRMLRRLGELEARWKSVLEPRLPTGPLPPGPETIIDQFERIEKLHSRIGRARITEKPEDVPRLAEETSRLMDEVGKLQKRSSGSEAFQIAVLDLLSQGAWRR